MLVSNAYAVTYVESCRSEFAAQLAAYRDLIAAASKASTTGLTRVEAALAAFEPGFFNNLLIALDARFVHRPRSVRTEAGHPLDEVHLLVSSLMTHGGVMTADGTTPYEAGKAVLKIDVGDRIALNADDFETLIAAFLAAIETTTPDCNPRPA